MKGAEWLRRFFPKKQKRHVSITPDPVTAILPTTKERSKTGKKEETTGILGKFVIEKSVIMIHTDEKV